MFYGPPSGPGSPLAPVPAPKDARRCDRLAGEQRRPGGGPHALARRQGAGGRKRFSRACILRLEWSRCWLAPGRIAERAMSPDHLCSAAAQPAGETEAATGALHWPCQLRVSMSAGVRASTSERSIRSWAFWPISPPRPNTRARAPPPPPPLPPSRLPATSRLLLHPWPSARLAALRRRTLSTRGSTACASWSRATTALPR